ncbi:MAG: class I SAM-dependent methyltransferase [bacterium]
MTYSLRNNPKCPFGNLKWKEYYWERPSKKVSYEEEYWGDAIDPDGNTRNLINEWDQQIENYKHIFNYLHQIKPGKILDVGCGPGFFLSRLNNEWDKYGIDISNKAIKLSSRYASVKTCELPNANYSQEFFDVITMIHLIEHLTDPILYIETVKKILKNGGVFILETPDFDSACARRFGLNYRMLHDSGHISLFTFYSLIKLLEDFNFEIVSIEFPFFETKYFTKKNMLRIMDKKKISPPFYGNHITLYSIKRK